MSLIPKTYDIARKPIQAMLKRWRWLRYVPIFRQYAPGGRFATKESSEQTQKEWEEKQK